MLLPSHQQQSSDEKLAVAGAWPKQGPVAVLVVAAVELELVLAPALLVVVQVRVLVQVEAVVLVLVLALVALSAALAWVHYLVIAQIELAMPCWMLHQF